MDETRSVSADAPQPPTTLNTQHDHSSPTPVELTEARARPPQPGDTRDTTGFSLRALPAGPREFPVVPGYEILGIMGHGGMGVVYRARQLKANRVVALKMIRAVEHSSEYDRLRFQIETEAVARLQHPNIVQLYEVGEVHGQPYFSLEFCDGGTLDTYLNKSPAAPREAAELIEALARAMHYAHLRGVVHRDLKPANILLAACGLAEGASAKPQAAVTMPKITDFGLAKRTDAEARDISRSGTVMGTPSYMAPEQAAGKVRDTGPAADVYSLGALLYVCLTGRPPFHGATTLETLYQVLHDEPPPPSRLEPKVPRDLETICLKCLQKEPRKRYGSAAELAEDLGRFLRREPVVARPVGRAERLWRWCRREPALAAASGLAAAALIAIAALAVRSAANQSRAAAVLRAEQERTIAALGDAQAEQEIAEAALQEAEVRRTEAETALREAQDRRKEADTQRRQALRLSANLALDRGLGLCEQGDVGLGLLWLARSLEIAPREEVDLRFAIRANLNGWRRELHLLKAPLPHRDFIYAVAFSPDSKLALTASADGTAQVWETTSGKMTARLAHPSYVYAAAFSPDGKTILTGGEDGAARFWDVATGKERGDALQHRYAVRTVAFSRDGKYVLTGTDLDRNDSRTNTAELWLAATGERVAGFRPHHSSVLCVAFSTDGKCFLTGSADGTAKLWDAADQKPIGAPFRHDAEVLSVAFSPDGKTFLTASEDFTARLWEREGGQPIKPILRHQGPVRSVAFSPDGKTILTGSWDRTARLWDTATLTPVVPVLRHPAPVYAVAISPDGKRFLTAGLDRTAHLWEKARGTALGPPLRHPQSIWSVAVSPDGKTLLTGCQDGLARLWDAQTGRLLRDDLRQPRGRCWPWRSAPTAKQF